MSGVKTSTSPPNPSTGIGTSTRMVAALMSGLIIGIVALLWNTQSFGNRRESIWIGNLAVIPLVATAVTFLMNCIIQNLSCGYTEVGYQANHMASVPFPFMLLSLILQFFTFLLWPIEGIYQSSPEEIRRGVSYAFYFFWAGTFNQAYQNSFAQRCSK
jgi:hypothetical protein